MLVFVKSYYFLILGDKFDLFNPRVNNYLFILSKLTGYFIFFFFLYSANRRFLSFLITFGSFLCALIAFFVDQLFEKVISDYVGIVMTSKISLKILIKSVNRIYRWNWHILCLSLQYRALSDKYQGV